jgi:putative hemolysin
MNSPVSKGTMKFEFANERFWVKTASSLQELAAIQKFRYEIFSREMGLRNPDGLDADYYDAFCDHLYVMDKSTDQIAGVYRLLPGDRAVEAQSFYCEEEFDLRRMEMPRSRILELGRSCVHPDYRNGSIIQLLWMAISAYFDQGGFDMLMGAVSIPENREALLDRMSAYFARHAAAPIPLQAEVKEDYRLTRSYPTLMHYRRFAKPGDLRVHHFLPPLFKGYLQGSGIRVVDWIQPWACSLFPSGVSAKASHRHPDP